MKKNKKLTVAAVLACMLFGCQVDKNNIETLIPHTIEEAITREVPERVNMNKGLISYYLQPSVGRVESNPSASVFLMDGNYVILNIDVTSIVTRKYYNPNSEELRDYQAFETVVYEEEGHFTTATDIVRAYRYRLYELEDEQYGMMLQTSNMLCIATAPIGDTISVTSGMFDLLRTVRCDEEAVVAEYSQKELIQYQKETLDIFEKIYPESGTLQEMFDEYNE
ncbi:MAG: hypothetical protein HUJ58_04725 [Erysipelotrichaceae bacterium]|nr:hypothetical protein [Erysipelotrichaceae bacterium]